MKEGGEEMVKDGREGGVRGDGEGWREGGVRGGDGEGWEGDDYLQLLTFFAALSCC